MYNLLKFSLFERITKYAYKLLSRLLLLKQQSGFKMWVSVIKSEVTVEKETNKNRFTFNPEIKSNLETV